MDFLQSEVGKYSPEQYFVGEAKLPLLSPEPFRLSSQERGGNFFSPLSRAMSLIDNKGIRLRYSQLYWHQSDWLITMINQKEKQIQIILLNLNKVRHVEMFDFLLSLIDYE